MEKLIPISSTSDSSSDVDSIVNEKGAGSKTELESISIVISQSDPSDFIYDTASGLPLPDVSEDLPIETNPLSVRALIIGCMLGAVVQASNLYLGLKTGFTFGPALFGSIGGFIILKSLSKILPVWFGGGYFGEKENVVCQTAATSAGGLGILFVSGVPAMYQLNLLSKTPMEDIGRLLAFTACCAFFGMSFAIPLRRFFILKQRLVFPTPTATALTIRSLHCGLEGAAVAKTKGRTLLGSFSFAIVLRVVSQYAPGVLFDWHPFWWMASWGWKSVLAADNWGFFLELTPAFIGAGILSGVNASLSLYFGGIFFYGFLGPLLVRLGVCVGNSHEVNGWNIVNYNSMVFADPQGIVSPRYWILWGGILLMIVASFAELFCNFKSFYNGGKNLVLETINTIQIRRGKDAKYVIDEGEVVDPSPPEDQVPTYIWAGLLVVVIISTVVVMSKMFHIDIGISILSILLGFLFSFVGVQTAGATDINPISTCAKATQLIVGGITAKSMPAPIPPAVNIEAMKVNLLAALITGAAASQSTDMVGDLKTAYLLKAKPKHMFYAQVCGAVVSIFLSVGLFVLFAEAYPCILNADAPTCAFGIPSVSAWKAIAIATTSSNGLPLPSSSGIFAIVLSLVGLAVVLVKNFYVSEENRGYIPNPVAFGLAAILPPGQLQFGLAMAIGAVGAFFWKKMKPKQYDVYCYPLAGGLIAGEGLGGVVNALLVVLGVDGSVHGSALGCPANVYCG